MEIGLKKEDSAGLKGIAVCMMIFHHCYRTADKFQKYDVIFRGISANQTITIAACMKICVAIFAFVSGYGLMYGYGKKVTRQNSENVTRWIMQHLVSTMSGYWFIAVGSYIAYIILKRPDFHQWGETFSQKLFTVGTDIFGFSGLMGTKSLNGSWWYMSTAVVFILLVPVLAVLLDKFGSIICLGLVFLFPRLTEIGFPGGTGTFSFLIIFVVGMICCRNHFFSWFHKVGQNRVGKRILKFALSVSVVAFAFYLYPRLELKIFWEYKYALVPFLTIIVCVEYLFRIPLVSAAFQYLGKHSMNIWLVHTFVRDWMGEIVFGVKEFWLIPIVILLFSLVISICINLLKRITGYDRLIQLVQSKLR